MAVRVLLYFGLLAMGGILSNKGFIHEKLMKRISPIQTLLLFTLIFVMGIRVGMDEQVVKTIGQIGIIAVVFAIVTAGLSMLFVYIVRKRFFNDKRITGGKND